MYAIRRFEKVQEWLDANAAMPDSAMATWLKTAVADPRNVADGVLLRPAWRRTLYYAAVPGTNATVAYFVGDTPRRTITIVSVVPGPESPRLQTPLDFN